MPPVSAFVSIFPLAFLTFVRHVVMRPIVFCLHWYNRQHVLHHCFKEIHITCNNEIFSSVELLKPELADYCHVDHYNIRYSNYLLSILNEYFAIFREISLYLLNDSPYKPSK